jgi:hypothetical protein
MLILHGSPQQATLAKALLEAFAMFTGLQINYQKSTFVPMHMTELESLSIANILGCNISSLPCTYLGLPLSVHKISRANLQPVIQRIGARLPGWMPRMLGSGGRLQIINSVISAIPNFFMACIQWDAASIEIINKLIRAFLWKNKKDIHGGHCLLAWEIVTMPKDQGGLGIRNLMRHNQALMANLATKLLTEGAGPCFGWLSRWYLQNQIPEAPSAQDTPFWKSMVKHITLVQSTTRCTINSCRKTAFWNDVWTGLGKLRETFPNLFTFANNSSYTVRSQFQDNAWELDLYDNLSQSAHNERLELQLYLQANHPSLGDAVDERLLITTGKKPTTGDFYKLLCDRGTRWLPYNWVWSKTVPSRHKFFLWLAFHGRLNTKDNMTRKKWCQDAGCDLCPAVESIDHITLHCKFSAWAWDKWNLAQRASHALSIRQFFLQVLGNKQGDRAKVWIICFVACMLNLWKMRNERLFNNKLVNRRQFKRLVAQDIELWANRTPKLRGELMQWVVAIQD